MIFSSFLIFLGVGSHIVPGKYVKGQPLIYDQTKRLTYKINGLNLFFCLIGFFFFGSYYMKWFEPTLVYDHFGPIFTTVNIFATLLTITLFITGITSGRVSFF